MPILDNRIKPVLVMQWQAHAYTCSSDEDVVVCMAYGDIVDEAPSAEPRRYIFGVMGDNAVCDSRKVQFMQSSNAPRTLYVKLAVILEQCNKLGVWVSEKASNVLGLALKAPKRYKRATRAT